jgi:hypothetical protein
MASKHSNKQRGHAKAGHADISTKKHGKPIQPQDMPVHDMKGRPTDQHQGTQLGMEPSPANMPQTMQGPAQYPGQDIGA